MIHVPKRLEERRFDSVNEIRKPYLCSKLHAHFFVAGIFFSFLNVFIFHMHMCIISQWIIVQNQHGFMSGRFVATDLVTSLSDVAPSVCCREQTDPAYFNCRKAFGRVKHEILLSKLSFHGLSVHYCSWFSGYL